MKVKHHQQQNLPRASWDSSSSSCSHRTNYLRPLVPKLDVSLPPPPAPPAAAAAAAHDEAVGGNSNTRWNPTEEQIGMLEMLYSRGMRTPNSHQIENIAAHLSNYGKIQPKNVFYWFQNHKARERQKLKRLNRTTTPTSLFTFHHQTSKEEKEESEEISTKKKKCTSWTFHKLLLEETSLSHTLITSRLQGDEFEITNYKDNDGNEDGLKKTLQLFPLHPEATKMD